MMGNQARYLRETVLIVAGPSMHREVTERPARSEPQTKAGLRPRGGKGWLESGCRRDEAGAQSDDGEYAEANDVIIRPPIRVA